MARYGEKKQAGLLWFAWSPVFGSQTVSCAIMNFLFVKCVFMKTHDYGILCRYVAYCFARQGRAFVFLFIHTSLGGGRNHGILHMLLLMTPGANRMSLQTHTHTPHLE